MIVLGIGSSLLALALVLFALAGSRVALTALEHERARLREVDQDATRRQVVALEAKVGEVAKRVEGHAAELISVRQGLFPGKR